MIVDTEAKLGGPTHMIAQNIANGRAKIENPDPAVSLFNFHYATPPDVIALNAGLKKAIRRRRDGIPRQRRPGLPHRGLGVPAGGRKRFQQPRLFVHDAASQRHRRGQAPDARRRRAVAAQATDDLARLPVRIRVRADEAGSIRDQGGRSRKSDRLGPGRHRAGVCGLLERRRTR